MSGWSNPPLETPQVEQPATGELNDQVMQVHPTDYARVVDYVRLTFDRLCENYRSSFERFEILEPIIMDFADRLVEIIVPSADCPINYMRLYASSKDIQFYEIALTKYYVGLEDRKHIEYDVARVKGILVNAFSGE